VFDEIVHARAGFEHPVRDVFGEREHMLW
jgi:hypothetical protein